MQTRASNDRPIHKAINLAEPGDVIGVYSGGDTTEALEVGTSEKGYLS